MQNPLTFLSDSQLSELLSIVAKDIPTINADGVYYDQTAIPDSLPPNWMTPIASSTSSINGLMPGQLSTFGHFQLEPDQALIIKVPEIDAGYYGLELANAWGQNVPIVTAQGSLNNTDTFESSDGYIYYVISSKDPGVANWINDGGLANGMLGVRWQDVATAPTSNAVHAEVVNMADVKSHLPADTPVVTPRSRRRCCTTACSTGITPRTRTTTSTGWARTCCRTRSRRPSATTRSTRSLVARMACRQSLTG